MTETSTIAGGVNPPPHRGAPLDPGAARRLALLSEHSTDVLCEVREGVIAYVSPNCVQVAGLPPEHYVGRAFADMVHPDDRAGFARFRVPGWTGTIIGDFRVQDASGAWKWREARGVRERDANGEHSALLVLRDIHERREAEAALRESERRFRELADSAPFVIYMTDERFRTVFVNKAMLEFTGRTFEEQLAVPLGVNRHPADAPALRAATRDAIERRGRFTTEQRYRNAAGEYRWLLTDAHPRFDHAGNHAGYIGYSIDITDRRAAEDGLRQSEEHASALLNAVPDLMFRLSRDGVYLDFKAERDEDLYVAPARIIGSTIRELLPVELAELVMTEIGLALDGNCVRTIEYSLPKQGEPHDYETRICASGPDEVVVMARDVTGRNRAERALRESERRLRLIFHNAPLIVFAIDAAGIITAADGKGLDAVDLRSEDLAGQSAFQLYADVPATLDALRRALQGRAQTLTVEVRGVTWHAHLEPVFEDGAVTGVIGVAVDLSDRLRAEQALAESEERYRDMVEGLSDVMFTLDSSGCFTAINAAGIRMYGPGVVGANFAQFIDPRSLPGALEQLRRELRCDGVRRPEELLTRGADGRDIWLEVQASAIVTDGVVTGVRGIARDVTERKAAEQQVREAQDREAVWGERQRIAEELHDNVAQFFFGIGMASKDLIGKKAPAASTVRRRLRQIQRLASDGGQEVRNVVSALSSPALSAGLDAGIARLIDELRAATGIQAEYTRVGTQRLPADVQAALFSAAHEALYNVRKHARATGVSIRLSASGARATLTISDDGGGDAPAIEGAIAAGAGFGLRNLKRRFEAAGGGVAVETAGAGITITFSIPVEAAA